MVHWSQNVEPDYGGVRRNRTVYYLKFALRFIALCVVPIVLAMYWKDPERFHHLSMSHFIMF